MDVTNTFRARQRAGPRREARAVHDHFDGRFVVLVAQREVVMAFRRGARAGHFAFDPDGVGERLFDTPFQIATKLAHG